MKNYTFFFLLDIFKLPTHPMDTLKPLIIMKFTSFRLEATIHPYKAEIVSSHPNNHKVMNLSLDLRME